MTIDVDKIQSELHEEYQQRLDTIQHMVLWELLSGRRDVPDTKFKFVAYINYETYRGISLDDIRAHLAKIGVNVQSIGVFFDGLRMTFNPNFVCNYEPVMKTVTKSHWFRKDSLVEVPANAIDRVKIALIDLYPSFTDEQLVKYILRDGIVSRNGKHIFAVAFNDIRYFAVRDFARRQGATRTKGYVLDGDVFTFDF